MNWFPQYQKKNIRFLFLLRGFFKLILPSAGYTKKLMALYHSATPEEKSSIHRRADYYNKLLAPFSVNETGTSIREFRISKKHRQKSNFFFDLYEHLRHFNGNLRFYYRFGDKYFVPEVPTLLKAREVSDQNANAVLMKLNKVRHFNFVTDPIPYDDKLDRIVWRGNARREHRRKVVQQFHDHPLCDIGQTNATGETVPWKKPYMGIRNQLRYKFILSMEGNDVATNLKWIMSSNSLCFMTQPTRETWFMEGKLIPNHHFVLINDEYSDLIDNICYYRAYPEQAKQIIKNANDWVAEFFDTDRETLISLCVLDKYFWLSGQHPRLGFYPYP